MTSPKSLNDRVVEAKFMAPLGKITARDKHNRVRAVVMPGSEGKQYRIIIRRFDAAVISCECSLLTNIGDQTCQGNIHGVCRHSIAAIIKAMADQGYTPRFRKSLDQIKQFAHTQRAIAMTNADTGNPIIFTLKSNVHNKHALYFVALETDLLGGKHV